MWIPNDVALDSVEAKAAFYYDTSCKGGDDWGCGSLGSLHENGEGVNPLAFFPAA